ncbi:MAG: bifunctional hydroxymethylpyrimidine kinase/phosphomethylpyrimidine kinase [Armatimonadetes bacterium]|nr:bifunctional hydroxymethylpyrimidine kinase/phosphomethylpyrimidine kinase [Armatimonadota bacterium]
MIPRAMTIAGSDSGGGAGIQADLKTFAVLGVFGTSAITALTAQNTTGVFGVVEMEPEFVTRQIEAVISDIGADAVKTGMLANAGIIEAVTDCAQRYALRPLVLDPVMIATSGVPLLHPEAIDVLKRRLLPLATVVTPNLHEAAVLTGREVATLEQMRDAARAIRDLGPGCVLIKGGHLEGEAVDLFYDGREFQVFGAERYETPHTHGTGCVLSAAITAHLAHGSAVREAVAKAKELVSAAIRGGLPLGRGRGPANPLVWRAR